MRHLALLALIAALLAFPVSADDNCDSLQSTTLTTGGLNASHWSCSGGGGTADLSDVFRPSSGHVATTDGDLALTTTGSVDPSALGGTWALSAANGGILATVGAPDIVEGSGQITFDPRYRSWGDTTATLETTPEVWRCGDVILCPFFTGGAWVSDCAGSGNPRHLMCFYDEEKWFGDPVNFPSGVAESIAALEVGDFAQFYRVSDPDTSSENAHVFEVVAKDDSDANGDAYITLNIIQTDEASPIPSDYPLSRREIQVVGSAGDYPVGFRGPIDIDETSIVTADTMHSGKWLYPNGIVETTSSDDYPILVGWTEDDGGGDWFYVAPLTGLNKALTTSSTVHWSPVGIRPGDPFIVIAPIMIASATVETVGGGTDQEDSSITFTADDGAVVEGVIFDQLSQVIFDWTATTGATIRVKHVGVRDAGRSNASTAMIGVAANKEVNWDVDYLGITGGRYFNQPAENKGMHGLRFADQGFAGNGVNGTVRDYAGRYLADDIWWSGSVDVCGTWDISRVHASYSMDENNTMSLLDTSLNGPCAGTVKANLIASELVCLGCYNANGGEGVVRCGGEIDRCTANGMVDIGSSNTGGASLACTCGTGLGRDPVHDTHCDDPDPMTCTNYLGIGLSGALAGQLRHLANFRIRDGAAGMGSWTGTTAGGQDNSAGNRPAIIRDGIIGPAFTRASSGWWSGFGNTAGHLFQNLVVFDVDKDNGDGMTALVRWHPSAGPNVLRGITIALSSKIERQSDIVRLLRFEHTVDAENALQTIEDFVIAGQRGTEALQTSASAAANVDWEGAFVLWDNLNAAETANVDGANLTVIDGSAATVYRFQDPGFTDPGADNYEPAQGGLADIVGAGIGRGSVAGPGMTNKGWALWATRLEPERLSTTTQSPTPRIFLGDVDHDGSVTIRDVAIMERELLEPGSFSLGIWGDLDVDGELELEDVWALRRHLADVSLAAACSEGSYL